MIEIKLIQDFLKNEKLDGWLLADFHARNNIAVDFLDLPLHLTRRSFYFIPAQGDPTALVANIEKDRFVNLPGKKITFVSYQSLESALKELVSFKSALSPARSTS